MGCPVAGPHAVPTSPQPDSTDASNPSVKDCSRILANYGGVGQGDGGLRIDAVVGVDVGFDACAVGGLVGGIDD